MGCSPLWRLHHCGLASPPLLLTLPSMPPPTWPRTKHSYHEGDPADSRMTATARGRGVTLTSRSRPLIPADLAEVTMDSARLAGVGRCVGGAVPAGTCQGRFLRVRRATVPAEKHSRQSAKLQSLPLHLPHASPQAV